MRDPVNTGFEEGGFEPEEMVWVRGADYVSGWRDAQEAGTALLDAAASAGVDITGSRMQPQAGPDGSGLVRLHLPAAVARALAERLRTEES